DRAGGGPTGRRVFQDQREAAVLDVLGGKVGFHHRPALDDADVRVARVFDDNRAFGQREDAAAGERALHRRDEEPAPFEAAGGADAGGVDVHVVAVPHAVAGDGGRQRDDRDVLHLGELG